MRLIALLATLPLAACSYHSNSDSKPGVAGSGSGDARSYPVADFTGVALHGSDNVDVRVGSAFSVRAEGPAKELDKLKIEKVGDTLRVARREGNLFNWSSDDKAVTIHVTMPRITGADVAGSGA